MAPTLGPPLPPFPAPTPGSGGWSWGCSSARTGLVQQGLSAAQPQCIWWQFLNSAHSPGPRPCWPLSKLQQEASSAGLSWTDCGGRSTTGTAEVRKSCLVTQGRRFRAQGVAPPHRGATI